MIILDSNQIMYSNILMSLNKGETEIEPMLIRHMILNTIRSINSKYKKQGPLVIATDHYKSWRRDAFPYYKHSRRENRESSGIDWSALFSVMQQVREELKEYFPYPVIQVEGCEADDIIATLINSTLDNVLIVSGDKDFIQLHNDRVTQYDPVKKKMVVSADPPQVYLRKHVIRGDSGDGIPNILSQDDSFVIKKRQKPITENRLKTWLFVKPEQAFDSETMKRYNRNSLLIDLKNTPVELQDKILDAYKSQLGKDKSKIFNYMIANKMTNLMKSIQDF